MDVGIFWIAIATIFATFFGPIAAIQAQKWVENWQEKKKRKQWIFNILMAHRKDRYSSRTLEAMNSIDIAFDGGLPAKQSNADREVTEKWEQWLAHMSPNPRIEVNDPRLQHWSDTADNLFFELLHAMSRSLGYEFPMSALRRGGYFSTGQATAEQESHAMRTAALKFFEGRGVVHVVAHQPIPSDSAAVAELGQSGNGGHGNRGEV